MNDRRFNIFYCFMKFIWKNSIWSLSETNCMTASIDMMHFIRDEATFFLIVFFSIFIFTNINHYVILYLLILIIKLTIVWPLHLFRLVSNLFLQLICLACSSIPRTFNGFKSCTILVRFYSFDFHDFDLYKMWHFYGEW